MVQPLPPDPSAASVERHPTGGEDLFVEPVASRHPDASRTVTCPPAARIERLRRLLLEVEVAALRRDLERARERRAAVIERYERVLDARNGVEHSPAFSWSRP